MARQNKYSNDISIGGADRLTGVRSENSSTANYTIDDIASYLANTGNSDGSRLGFRYEYGGEYDSSKALKAGKIYVTYLEDSDTKNFSNIRMLHFKDISKDAADIKPIRSELAGGVLKIANTSTPEQRDYGVYRVTTSKALTGKTDETELTLLYIASSGSLGFDDLVISPFQTGIGVESEGVTLRSGEPEPEGNEVGLVGDFYIQFEVDPDDEERTPVRLYGPKESSNGAADWGPGVSMRGVAATIAVGDTTTLPAGDNARVEEHPDSNDNDAIFNFFIPQGVDGTDGTDGTDGNGIEGVSSNGNGTFTITFTDGTTFTTDDFRGTNGTDGTDGTDGVDGATILEGDGAPSPILGNVGDIYLDRLTDELYGPKTDAEAWLATPPISIRGVQGETGEKGDTGDAGTDGTDGTDGRTVLNGTVDPVATDGVDGDFYINTTNYHIFGPKAGGVWPAGVDLEADGHISVQHDDEAEIPTLNCLKFEGSGVSSIIVDPDDDNCAIITIAGGGAVVVEEIDDFSLTQSGFVSDAFNNFNQSVTFTASWTNPDIVNVVVTSLTIAADGTDFATFTETDLTDLDDASASIDVARTFDLLPDGEVVVTATLLYTDNDNVDQTLTDTVTLTAEKSVPVLAIAETYSDFDITPTSNLIEYNDTGVISYAPTISYNSWDSTPPVVPVLTPEPGSQGAYSGFTVTVDGDDEPIDSRFTTTFAQDQDDPSLQTTVVVDNVEFERIRSFRYGSVTSAAAPVWADTNAATFGIRNLTTADGFQAAGRTIEFGNTKPNPGVISITPAVGQFMYFVFDAAETDIEIRDGFNTPLHLFPSVLSNITLGGYRIFTFVNPTSISETNMFTIT